MKKMTAKERREQEKQKRAEVIRGKQEANRKNAKTAATQDATAPVRHKNAKSLAKAAGLKSTFTLPTGELLMTSFGRGSEALIQKRIIADKISDVQKGVPAFSVIAKPKQFEIQGRAISDPQRKEPAVQEALTDDPRDSRKAAGADLIGAKDALEKRYFGKTFTDNIHIQLIYRILDIKKVLAIHANNIVYTLDNLSRREGTEGTDFIGIGGLTLKNSYAAYCEPRAFFDESVEAEKKIITNIENSHREFSEYVKNPRLSYYGEAFYRKRSDSELYELGKERYNKMSDAERDAFDRKYPDDMNNRKKRSDAIMKLVSEHVRKPEEEIYYILAMLSELRQCMFHDSAASRSWLYNLEKVLPAEAMQVLDGVYSQKVAALNNFSKTSSKSNFRLLFNALHADTDAQKKQIAEDFYKFSVRETYKNISFSIKLLRESMLDAFAPEYKEKSYDSVRGKLYQLVDFLIWNTYDKNKNMADALVAQLRAEVKRDRNEKSLVYDREAARLWPMIREAVAQTAKTLRAVTLSNNTPGSIKIKELALSKYDRDLVENAIDSAVDERGRRLKITDEASYFSKLIYLLTLFLDGKEINDLITTLVNSFDEIDSFCCVLQKAKLDRGFTEGYRSFAHSAEISQELRAINSFARMTTETVQGKPCMFEDAADLLGMDTDLEEVREALEAFYNKEKMSLKWTKDGQEADTGFRNFIISNVLKSSRFRYVVRYGNPKKLREVMQNEAVVKFVLNDLPEEQINRYSENILGLDAAAKEKKVSELARFLRALSLEDFRDVEQSANAARNARKARYQGAMSLYLNVIYQIIKNMVYINSRYTLAFAKYEHDASLLLDNWVYDPYKTVFSDLTEDSLQKGKLNRRAAKYLQTNLEHSDNTLIRQYRNSVAHLNAVRNMNLYIGDLREITSYFGIYHYIMQRDLITRCQKLKMKNPVVVGYFDKVRTYRTYCKDLVKALNITFGYNLPRYKNLSIEGLFDKNRPGDKKESALIAE